MAVELKLETRKQRSVGNIFDNSKPAAGLQIEVDEYRRKYVAATHRTTAPCLSYNCHGLTFAARRAAIFDPKEVAKILADDSYQSIQRSDVLPGDIVVYHKDGDIEHSGLVVGKELFNLRILSKWGYAHEVVHFLSDCPYNAANVTFHRITN